jgi:hypothetical protein
MTDGGVTDGGITDGRMTDGRLRDARDRVRRLDRAGRQRAALAEQIARVEHELTELEKTYQDEAFDVARLEGVTLTSIVARVLGTKDDKLAKERAEEQVAWLKYAEHRQRHATMTAELSVLDQELADLASAPADYESALRSAEVALRTAGDPRAGELSSIAVRLADAGAALREHDEAFRAGRAAHDSVTAMLDHLRSAYTWSSVDMFTGGFADWMEHDRLARAQALARRSQAALDRFAREMADVGVTVQASVQVDPGAFMDWFFDNIIVDAVYHDRIRRTYQQTEAVAGWLGEHLAYLSARCVALSQERAALATERERLHGISTGS